MLHVEHEHCKTQTANAHSGHRPHIIIEDLNSQVLPLPLHLQHTAAHMAKSHKKMGARQLSATTLLQCTSTNKRDQLQKLNDGMGHGRDCHVGSAAQATNMGHGHHIRPLGHIIIKDLPDASASVRRRLAVLRGIMKYSRQCNVTGIHCSPYQGSTLLHTVHSHQAQIFTTL